jgi:hypothetical protein
LSRPRQRVVSFPACLSTCCSLHGTGRQIHSKCLAPLPNSRCCLHSRSPSTPTSLSLRCCCQPALVLAQWLTDSRLHAGGPMLRSWGSSPLQRFSACFAPRHIAA